MSGMILSRMQAVSSEMILSEGVLGFDATTLNFIPVDIGNSVQFTSTAKLDSKIIPVAAGKVLNPRPHAIPVVELGKRLLQCSCDGNTDAVRELMGKGAPFSTDWLGTSPLHFAAQGNHIKTCEALLRAGISKDARTKVERTPLHMACYEGHAAVVELLLKHGADVDCRDMLKMTPLHWAVQNEHDDCIKLLIQYGAEIDVVSKFDKTPLTMAIEQDRMDLAQILQTAMKVVSERVQNMELQRATLAATQSLTDELNVLEPPSKGPHIKENVPKNNYTNQPSEANNESNLNALKILEAHGITMIPNDDTSIVASAMESGQTVVLTEAGKLALNLTKPTTENNDTSLSVKGRKIITLRSDQFLALTSAKYQNILKKFNSTSNSADVSIKPLKRIVMTKNKITVSPKTNTGVAQIKINAMAKIETITKQLIEARRIADELKQKYKLKEREIEEFEKQLKFLKTL